MYVRKKPAVKRWIDACSYAGALLPAGALTATALLGEAPPIAMPASGGAVILAGLLVGYGARLGSGCTSGHGVCGLARLSPRSLAATAMFLGTAMATVFVVRHLIGA